MSEPRTAPVASGLESSVEEFFATGTPAYPVETTAAETVTPDAHLRLTCCGNLRSATPQHKDTCPRAWANCPGCTGKSAVHFSACRRSVFCCAGIDTPEAGGYVHADDCPVNPRGVTPSGARHVQPGRPLVPGEVPPALRAHLREGLICELLFAARRVAEANIGHSSLGTWCKECHLSATLDGNLSHAPSCAAGAVLRLIGALMEGAGEESVEAVDRPAARSVLLFGETLNSVVSALIAAEGFAEEELGRRRQSFLGEKSPYIDEAARVAGLLSAALGMFAGGAR
jgi:hypothetical protein